MDMVKKILFSLKKRINFVLGCGITDSLICPELAVWGYWSGIFIALNTFWRHILYISFSRDTFVFVNGDIIAGP